MSNEHKITMLGTGLIGMFYTKTLHDQRGHDRVHLIYSRNEEKAKQFAKEINARWTDEADTEGKEKRENY